MAAISMDAALIHEGVMQRVCKSILGNCMIWVDGYPIITWAKYLCINFKMSDYDSDIEVTLPTV